MTAKIGGSKMNLTKKFNQIAKEKRRLNDVINIDGWTVCLHFETNKMSVWKDKYGTDLAMEFIADLEDNSISIFSTGRYIKKEANWMLGVLRNMEVRGCDNDYAYSEIEEYEDIAGYKVDEKFRLGWNTARLVNTQKYREK